MFGKEPTIILGALAEVFKSIIPMLIIFNIIEWSGEQVAQVMIVISVAVSFFSVLLTRQSVVPTERSNAQIEIALKEPKTSNLETVLAKNEKKEEKDAENE